MRMRSVESEKILWDIGLQTIRELEDERGILASARSEVYGCIFGRDSLITSLNLLKVYEKTGDAYFLSLVRKVLLNLAQLQGREVNIESGEEPGKCIHEFRPSGHEHLTKHTNNPWYVYPDNVMRNYDTVDATPLFLMTIHKYGRVSGDWQTVSDLLPNVRSALQWLETYGDSNGDGFVDYRFHPDRRHGGLKTQSWMDSQDSIFHEDGALPPYPIAPLEVQAYTYAAFRAWSDYFTASDPRYCEALAKRADDLKRRFNHSFVIRRRSGVSLAFALDGNQRPLISARSSMAHVLWAAWEKNGVRDSILDEQYRSVIVKRLMARDLFFARAGIRTLSAKSRLYFPNSYHNGSIWPHDTAIAAEGLENFGYIEESQRVRRALLFAYRHFATPIELFVYQNRKYGEYAPAQGGGACRQQAWSAAALLCTVRSFET
jgi:glycogen debranching enzyme